MLLEPRNTADAIRAWSEALKLGGPEGQAAGLRLGEIRLSLGEKESAQALADWKQALAQVNGPEDYHNPHIELKKVREWFDKAIRRFHEGSDPQRTQEIAELYGKIAPAGAAEKVIAEAAEALAEHLDGHKAAPAEVRIQYRRAGEAYEKAAAVRPDAERPGLLWRSGQCYLSAKDTALTLKILKEHVKIEKNELRLSESWSIAGDLYRIQGNKGDAREAYHKVLECNPETPFACKARYFLASEKIEAKNFKEAYLILKDNVDMVGNVDRSWQEKSQFKLASLLMQMEKYEEARIQLIECLRFFDNANALLRANSSADAIASWPRKKRARKRSSASGFGASWMAIAARNWKRCSATCASGTSSCCGKPSPPMNA